MRRQQAFENITRRNPSAFEYAEAEAIDLTVENNVEDVQVPASQPTLSIRASSVFIRPPTA